MCTPPSTCLWKVICTHLFLFMIIICRGLSFLWESFLFMRIFFYLWSSVRVFSLYENLFLFMIICKNLFFLWELFWIFFIYDHLWENLFLFMIIYFITYFLSHFSICACVLILIFFHYSKSILICMHSSWSVWMENLHEHK